MHSIVQRLQAFAALALATFAVSCAEPVKEINYVQPGYITKAIFEKDWYYRQTITESDPGTGLAGVFVGLEADVEKVAWEIREDQLLAYRTHEGVPGIDEDRTLPGARYKGDLVAQFSITSHFDIQRGYNASTGEKTPVIDENEDRPWNEREFMRIEVDTSVGGPADFGDFLTFVNTFIGGSTTVGFFDDYRYSPDQPVIEPGYLEWTTRRDIGDDFTCGMIYGEWGCTSAQVNVRQSFWQIDHAEQQQFEPHLYADIIPYTDEAGKKLKTINLPVPLKRLASNDFGNTPLQLQGKCAEYAENPCPGNLKCIDVPEPEFPGYCACTANSDCTDGLTCTQGLCRGCEDGLACGFTRVCRDGLCDDGCNSDSECTREEACVRTFDDLKLGKPGECSVPFAEAECTPDLFEALDKAFAPGYYGQDDCDESNYHQFERHGLFRTERPGYNRETGTGRDEQRQFFANIHQIWQQSYEIDEATKSDPVPTLKMAGPAGEQKPVAIPMENRKPRPVVFYINIGFPEDLYSETVKIAGDWDVAMMGAVQAATKRTDKALRDEIEAYSKANSPGALFLPTDGLQHKGMFQIRENNCSRRGVTAYLDAHSDFYPHVEAALKANEHEPTSSILKGDEPTDWTAAAKKSLSERLVPGNLHRVCATLKRATLDAGEAAFFQYQKFGDVRFSFLNWVNEQQPDGPGGYGPSGTDGETGHIISANANIYGANLDYYAAITVDMMRAINGDLDQKDLLRGKNVTEWIERSEKRGRVKQGLSEETVKKADARRQAVRSKMGLPASQERQAQFNDPRAMTDRFKAIKQMAKPVQMNENVRSAGWERFDRAMQDPDFAAMMVPNEFGELLAPVYNEGKPADQPTPALKTAALEASTDLKKFAKRFERRNAFLSKHHIDMMEMVDDAVIGKALELKDEDPEVMYQLLRRELFRAVTLHEFGHTMGLTHNFEGSYDSLNYQDEYWKKRNTIRPGDNDGDGVDDLAAAKLPEYTYSTIMDYHSRFNSDFKGLGKYDLAAMKAAYARTNEVFADEIKMPAVPDLGLYVAYVFGGDALPSLLRESIGNLTNRKDVKIAEIVKSRAADIQANTDAVIDSISNFGAEYEAPRDVPYAYCEHAYLFRSRCKMFDLGATNSDVVHNSIVRYWNYYYFNNFRRGRLERPFINNFFSRQSGLMDDVTYAIRYYIYTNGGNGTIDRDLLSAALESLNFINSVMGTPTPGRHCLNEDRGVFLPDEGQECEQAVDVPEGLGRDQFVKYDDQYIYNIDYIGTFFDKSNFMIFLLDDSTNFFNVTDLGDSRRFSINYYRMFRPELIRMVRDMVFSYLGEDTNSTFGLQVNRDGKVSETNLVDPTYWGFDPEDGEDGPAPVSLLRVDAPVAPAMLWRALGLSAVFNSSAFDGETDFRDYIMVFEEGSGEARDLPAEIEVVKYLDPITHVTYVAPKVLDGESISVELFNYFNAKAAEFAALETQLAEDPDNAEIQADLDARRPQFGHYSDLITQFRAFRRASEPYDD